MGALGLSEMLTQVESHAGRGDLTEAVALVPRIQQELRRVERALSVELGPVAS